jgi:hypothetical protein
VKTASLKTLPLILGNSEADLLTIQHSFHGEVWSYGRLPLSIPLVQLRAAHEPNPRRTRFRARSGSAYAPGIDSASLRSTSPR